MNDPRPAGRRPRARTGARACLVLLAACAAGPARTAEGADAPEAPPAPLTLADCVRLALRTADAGGVLNNQKSLADAARRETDAQSRPQLSVTVDGRQYSDGEQDYGVSVSLGEHVLEIPQNMVRRRIARQRAAVAETRTVRERLRYEVQVRLACIRCLEAGDAAGLAHARAGAAADRHKALDGAATDDPRMRRAAAAAALDAGQRAVESRDAAAAERTARERVAALCGLPSAALVLAEPPDYAFPPVELEDCLRWARAHRGDLAALQAEREVMTLVARLAGLERIPRPRLSFGYDSGESQMDETRGNFAMLGLEIPIWDAGEVQARKDQALARLDGLAASLLQTEAEVSQSVTDAFIHLRQAVHDLQRLRADPGPADAFREAGVRLAHGAIAPADHAEARFRNEEHAARIRAANRACHAAHATLLEALQATDGDLASGLKPPAPAAGDAPAP